MIDRINYTPHAWIWFSFPRTWPTLLVSCSAKNKINILDFMIVKYFSTWNVMTFPLLEHKLFSIISNFFFLHIAYSSDSRKYNLLYQKIGLFEIKLMESNQKLMFLERREIKILPLKLCFGLTFECFWKSTNLFGLIQFVHELALCFQRF